MQKIKKQREAAAPNRLGDPRKINKEIHRPEEALDIQFELISLIAWCTYPMIMLARITY